MIEFVEECRRVWRQLGVPDPVANEMAADLTADLLEAEAEGGSAEDVLGNSAFDAPGFAASWAAARGVTTTLPTTTLPTTTLPTTTLPTTWPPVVPRRRPPIAVVLTGLASLLALGAGLVLLGTGRSAATITVAARRALAQVPFDFAGGPGRLPDQVPGPPSAVFIHQAGIGVGPQLWPLGLVLLVLGAVGLGLALWYWSPWSAPRPRQLRVGRRA